MSAGVILHSWANLLFPKPAKDSQKRKKNLEKKKKKETIMQVLDLSPDLMNQNLQRGAPHEPQNKADLGGAGPALQSSKPLGGRALY